MLFALINRSEKDADVPLAVFQKFPHLYLDNSQHLLKPVKQLLTVRDLNCFNNDTTIAQNRLARPRETLQEKTADPNNSR